MTTLAPYKSSLMRFYTYSLAAFTCLALGTASTRAQQPDCSTLSKGTAVTLSGRLEAADKGGDGGMFYTISAPDGLPCTLGKLMSVQMHVGAAARPICRTGQIMTVIGSAEFDMVMFGVSVVNITPTQFSCR